jgi:hypothetical protein
MNRRVWKPLRHNIEPLPMHGSVNTMCLGGIIYVQIEKSRGKYWTLWHPCLHLPWGWHFAFNRNPVYWNQPSVNTWKQAPRIHTLSIRRREFVSFKPRPPHLGTHWIWGWASPTARTQTEGKRKVLLLLSGLERWFFGRPARSLVTIFINLSLRHQCY